MKRALISPVFPPYRSGQGTVAWENARMSAESGVETHVYTPHYRTVSQAERDEVRDDVHVHRVRPIFAYGNAAFLPQLFWRLKSATILHLHYPALGMEIPVLFWSFFGKRLVTTYHMDLVGKGSLMRAIFKVYSFIFLPLVLNRSSVIFVTSYDYAESSPLIGSFFKANKKKFVELPCSVDTDHFRPRIVDRASDTMLFVGALDSAHYSKGVPVLLEAFAQAYRDPSSSLGMTGCKLVIIGDGDLRSAYAQRATELGIADRVLFLGSVDHEELLHRYAQSRCLVLPSTDATEAFGVVIIEAAASGIPAIASSLRGVRSVIEDGVTGFLVEPGNANQLTEKMQWVIDHPDEAHVMGVAARRRVEENYSYEIVKKKYSSYL